MIEKNFQQAKKFLEENFNLIIPEGVWFQGMSKKKIQQWINRDGKVQCVTMDDLLNQRYWFNSSIDKQTAKIVKNEEAIVYMGVVTHGGRGEAARYTGGETLDNLKPYKKRNIIHKLFLSLQGDSNKPNPLCEYAQQEENEGFIDVYFVNNYRVCDKNGQELINQDAIGKTEHIIKLLLIISQEIKDKSLDPNKVIVGFMDDDYHLMGQRAHYAQFATMIWRWAESNKHSVLAEKCRNVGFVTNGGRRVYLQPAIAPRILRGYVLENYRAFLKHLVFLELGKSHPLCSQDDLIYLRNILENELDNRVIITQNNIKKVMGEKNKKIIDELAEEYCAKGGRVTDYYTTEVARHSRIFLNEWMSRLSYMFHGDRVTTLKNWLLLCLARSYGLEISWIVQALMEKKFESQILLDLFNTPHIHQPHSSVRGMRTFIGLVLDFFRCIYGLMSVAEFIEEYKNGILDIEGTAAGGYDRRYIRPPEGIFIYPPAKDLKLELKQSK